MITLEATKDGGWHRFLVRFSTEDQALAYIERKRGTVEVWEIEESEHAVPDQYERLLEVLHPTCEHGLSLSLCHGPGHYPSAEWERAQYGEW